LHLAVTPQQRRVGRLEQIQGLRLAVEEALDLVIPTLRLLELVLELIVLRVRLCRAIENLVVKLREVLFREIVALKLALQISALHKAYMRVSGGPA
jgi:hypothetical protein